MTYRTPRARVSGLGAAHHGTQHFWLQRVSAVALVLLAILFVIPFAQALGSPYDEVLATYRNPFNAVVAILFLGTAFFHLKLGVQVVIEDYVHSKAWRTGLLLGNAMFCWALGLTGVFAVLKIAFTG